MKQNLKPISGEVEIVDSIQVSIADHPFQAKTRIVHVVGGDSVAEILGELWQGKRPCSVRADGVRVPSEQRAYVRPRETLEIVGIPTDKASSVLKAVAAVVVTVVALVAAPYLAPFIAGAIGISAAIATTLIATALTIAGNLAVNALFPTSRPQLAFSPIALRSGGGAGAQTAAGSSAGTAASPTYSIGGGRNEYLPYGAVPSILGRHRMAPPYGAQLYAENVGTEQFLRGLLCWGHGNIDITNVQIGETPIVNYQDVTVVHTANFVGDTTPPLYPFQIFPEDLNIELEPGVNNIRTTADDTDEFFVDITAPQGLYRFEKATGNRVSYGVGIVVEYQSASGGGYTSVITTTLNGSDTTAIRKTYRVVVPRARYNIRVRRTTVKYVGEDSVSEAVLWTAMRSQRSQTPIVTDIPLAITAIRIKATAQLSGVIETMNGIVHSRVKSWNGSAWVDFTLSQNPADLFRHVLQGDANHRSVPDSKIDLDALADWADYCIAEGWTFNQIRDFKTSVWDVLRDIAAAGRAVIRFPDGKWSVSWDDPNAPVVQHFTLNNTSQFVSTRGYSELPHAFRVRFVNEDSGWRQDERIVYDDDYSAANATKFEALEFPGVTDPDLIWRHARYHIAQLRLRRETYEFKTDYEHLLCTRGDRVRVTHDIPKWGQQSGRVKAVAGDRITIEGDVSMIAPERYSIRFRLADGTSSLREVVSVSGTFSEIDLIADGSATSPEPGDLWMFGTFEAESVVLRVLGIRPGEDFSAVITLVDDAPGIYDADSGTIPAFDPQISEPINYFDIPPTGLQVNETLEIIQGGLFSTADLSWVAPARGDVQSYLVQYKHEADDDWSETITVQHPTLSVKISGLRSGSYRFRVKAVYGEEISTWSEEALLEAIGALQNPPDVSGFRSTVSGNTLILTWTAIPDLIVSSYEIRFSPSLSGATWATATPLQTGVVNNSLTTTYAKGTYLIKAVTLNNILSVNASLIVVGVEPATAFNVVETASDDPGFAGIHDRTYFSPANGGVILDSAAKFFTGGQFFTGGNFFSGSPGREPLGYYTLADSVDLGGVTTARLSADIAAGGFKLNSKFFTGGQFFTGSKFFSATPDQWNITAQVRTTDDNPAGSPTWSDWVDFTVGDYTARAYEFRLKFESLSPLVTPLVTSATFTVDMPDRIIAAEDIQSTASGITIPFSPPLQALKAVNVTGQDMATGDYFEITAKSKTGFTVNFKDSGGTGKDIAFDYQAIGYGSVI